MIQIVVLELMLTVSLSSPLSPLEHSSLPSPLEIGTIVRTLRHTATRMKQELANDRGLELAQVDDIPLWVAVSLSLLSPHRAY